MLTLIFGICALAIDLAYLMEIRAEMQNVADATALAAVSGLAVAGSDQDPVDEAIARARLYASRNTVLNNSVDLADPEIRIGAWDGAEGVFTETTVEPNSVRVILRRTAGRDGGDMPLFFAPVIGHRVANLQVSATAAFGPRKMALTLDRSGSMADDNDGADGSPVEPLSTVKEAAQGFVRSLLDNPILGDGVGLVTFDEVATRDHEVQSVSESFSAIMSSIQTMEIQYEDPDALQWACTNIADALYQSMLMLDAAVDPTLRGVKVVVLLSDGVPNTRLPWVGSPESDPCRYFGMGTSGNPAVSDALGQAGVLASEQVVIYAISLGESVVAEGGIPFMMELATLTGGEHFAVEDAAALPEVFQQIAERIPVILVE